MNPPSLRLSLALAAVAAVAAGCGGKNKDDAGAFVRKTPVTVAQAKEERVDAIEVTVGRLEATSAPALAPQRVHNPDRR